MLIRKFDQYVGRSVEEGASLALNALVVQGPESHGEYMSEGKIKPSVFDTPPPNLHIYPTYADFQKGLRISSRVEKAPTSRRRCGPRPRTSSKDMPQPPRRGSWAISFRSKARRQVEQVVLKYLAWVKRERACLVIFIVPSLRGLAGAFGVDGAAL